MTMTGARVSYLYDLMDAAYDAAAIHDHSKALGHAPIIDRNYRAQHEAKAESAKKVERMKLIHMPDPDDRLFDFRTMAERVNARLKDELAHGSSACAGDQGQMPPHVRRRRACRRRSNTPRHAVPARVGKPPPTHNPENEGDCVALIGFCKRLYILFIPYLYLTMAFCGSRGFAMLLAEPKSRTSAWSDKFPNVHRHGQQSVGAVPGVDHCSGKSPDQLSWPRPSMISRI